MKRKITLSLIIAGTFLFLFFVVFPIAKRFMYHAVDIQTSRNYYYDWAQREIHYIPIGNWFELGDNKITGADVETFRVVSDQYAKDKNNVYFHGTKIDGADAETFEYLCAAFGDEDQLWRGEFAKDKNRLYHGANHFENLDLENFSFVGETCGAYLTDSKHIYSTFYNFDDGSTEDFRDNKPIPCIPDADPNTFEVLDENYAGDDKQVFYKGVHLPGVERKTFISLNYNYAKSASIVYCNGEPLDGADPATFTLIKGGDYVKDKNAVYYYCSIVPGADSATFEMVSEGNKVNYAKDKNGYYHGGHPK